VLTAPAAPAAITLGLQHELGGVIESEIEIHGLMSFYAVRRMIRRGNTFPLSICIEEVNQDSHFPAKTSTLITYLL
jgi:hypothetical protein